MRGEDTIAANTIFLNLMSSRGHLSVNIGPRILTGLFMFFRDFPCPTQKLMS